MKVAVISVLKDKKTLETLKEKIIEYTEVREEEYYRPLIEVLYKMMKMF